METLVAILQLFLLWAKVSIEKDERKRKALKEASDLLSEGIKEKDSSKITQAFDKARRVK